MAFLDIHIPDDTLKVWQSLLELTALRSNIPAALIMKIDLPDIKVLLACKSKESPYRVGDSECLLGSGLYCEKVYKTKSSLLVPNALKDKDWDKNPDIKLGMISYLGFPLLWPNEDVFGTICVLDSKEIPYKEEQSNVLMKFKKYIECYLDWTLSKYLQSEPEKIAQKETHCDESLSQIEKLLGLATYKS